MTETNMPTLTITEHDIGLSVSVEYAGASGGRSFFHYRIKDTEAGTILDEGEDLSLGLIRHDDGMELQAMRTLATFLGASSENTTGEDDTFSELKSRLSDDINMANDFLDVLAFTIESALGREE